MRYTDPTDQYPGPGGPSASPSPTGNTPTASAPAPTPAPAAPPGTITYGGSPGSSPDYNGLITNDPGYLAAQASARQAQTSAAAQRKQLLQQAMIRYGGNLPPGFTDQYGDIDQSVLDQAGQNQFSTLANLSRSFDQSTEQFKRGLAARGALQSGDLNYGSDQLEQAYGQQRYDAANAFGSQVNDALSGYSGVLAGNANALSGAIQGAEANVYSNPAYRPTEPVAAKTATYDAGNSSAYGQPIYVGEDGSLYDQNGNPFKPAPPSASAAPDGSGVESSPYSWSWGGKI